MGRAVKFTTVTLSPAIDRAEYISSLSFGKTNRAEKTVISAGGKGINLSRALLELGANPSTVVFAGGHSGEFLKNLLEDEKIPARIIDSGCEIRTCIKYVTPYGVTEVNEAAELKIDPLTALVEELADTLVDNQSEHILFLCGSIPQPVDKNVYNSLITLFGQCGVRVVCDCEGEALVESLLASPMLIKPNKNELSSLAGREFCSEEELVDFCREIYVDNGTEVLCTLGENGSVFVGSEGVFKSSSHRIYGCDSTGAGDRFLANFVYRKYALGMGTQEALDKSSLALSEWLSKRRA